MIWTRVGDFTKRKDVRETYFPIFQNKSNGLNYVHFFALARPPPQIDSQLRQEIERYNDLVIFNVEEGYWISTFKLLSGMKFAACCCPNAKYFVKVDVDTYFRVVLFDSLLENLQEKSDRLLPKLKIAGFYGNSWENHVPLYTGVQIFPLPRLNYKPALERADIRKRYPLLFVMGAVEVYSMTLIDKILQYCPKHCYGHYNYSIPVNSTQECRGGDAEGEDKFFGSCVFSVFRYSVYFGRLYEGKHLMAMPRNNFTNLINGAYHENHVIIGQINQDGFMRKVHEFYKQFDGKFVFENQINQTL